MIKAGLQGSGIIAGIVLLSAGCIWYLQHHSMAREIVGANGRPVVLSAPSASGASIAMPSDTSSPSPVSEPSLRVYDGSSASSQPQAKTGSNAVPGPESFGQYEQYKDKTEALFGDLRLGTGAAAEVNKQVTVQYRGWLTNGKEFDESYAKGKPFTFVIGQHKVILGWEEAIYGMKVGGKRRFIVPPAVGYGAQETNGIPASSVLVFDVELLEVK